MKRRPGKIINSYGALWRLSQRNYERFIRDGMTKDVDPEDYGAKYIGIVAFTHTDAKPTDFRFEAESMGMKMPLDCDIGLSKRGK